MNHNQISFWIIWEQKQNDPMGDFAANNAITIMDQIVDPQRKKQKKIEM